MKTITRSKSLYSVIHRAKKLNYSVFILTIILATGLITAQGQPGKGLSLDDYKKLQSIKFNDLEEDTYLKINNEYILDRENKPYIFNFSDGLERRVYSYKVLDNEDRKEIASLLVYNQPTSGTSINVVIPNLNGEKAAWNLYIDDLKDNGAQTDGFLSCISFALSRELSTQLALNEGGNTASTAQSDDDYDFCFPAGSPISLKDGVKTIESVTNGDKVLAYDQFLNKYIETTILELKVHTAEKIFLTKVALVSAEEITASSGIQNNFSYLEIEATGNHPVLTKRGKVTVNQLKEGDILYKYEAAFNEFKEYKVESIYKNFRHTTNVYNLITDKGNYLINDIVVLDKMDH